MINYARPKYNNNIPFLFLLLFFFFNNNKLITVLARRRRRRRVTVNNGWSARVTRANFYIRISPRGAREVKSRERILRSGRDK